MTITEFNHYIKNNKVKPFVNIYISCLAQGFLLTVPVDTSIEKLFEKWEKILPKYYNEFTNDFCKEVATYWFELLSKCDVKSNDLTTELCKAANITIGGEKETVQVNLNKKTTFNELPKKQVYQKDPMTTPEISEQYKQRKQAEDVRLPELEKLNNVYNKAFSSKNVLEFLISHLTYAKYQQAKPVPKSTLPQSIRQNWESIIANEFHTIASDDFLVSLTNEWFYLVNQKGIPLNDQHQEELLMTFLAKQQVPKPIKQKKKPSLFKKLFGNP